MAIDYFSAAEDDIRMLPDLRRSLDMLGKKRDRLAKASAPRQTSAPDLSKPYVSIHNVNNTLNDLLSVAEVNRAIKTTESRIEETEKALGALPKELREVVVNYYVDGYTAFEIAERIGVESEKTVYAMRNKGVALFAVYMYGASANRPKRGKF